MKFAKFFVLGLTLFAAGCSFNKPLEIISAQQPDISALSTTAANIKPNLPQAKGERQSVLFSYLPIDDGLDFHIPFYLNSLEKTTSEKIYNVAFTDARGADNTFAWLINPDKSNDVISAKSIPAPGVKEMTTNLPETLAGAVSWAYSNYPGKFKAFSYLGHGGGFMGIASDATPGKEGPNKREMLSLNQFGTGLKTGLKGRKLNLIHLHGCLMANLEAAYELRDVSSVLVASEDVIGADQEGTEKPTEILNTLLQQTNPDARKIGKEIVTKVNPTQNPYGYSTASAIDLDKIAGVKTAVNVLSQTLIKAMTSDHDAILKAYISVPEFTNYSDSGQRDLWTFCKALLKIDNVNIQNDAAKVLSSLRNVLLHTRDSEGSSANGLSILMPTPQNASAGFGFDLNDYGYRNSRFASETQWDEFLLLILKK